MFKLMGSLAKMALFALGVIIAGNLVSWGGKTVNERVMAQLARIQSFGIAKKTQKWAGNLAHDAKAGYQKQFSQSQAELEKISSSERQKLRALIEELNTSSSAPARR